MSNIITRPKFIFNEPKRKEFKSFSGNFCTGSDLKHKDVGPHCYFNCYLFKLNIIVEILCYLYFGKKGMILICNLDVIISSFKDRNILLLEAEGIIHTSLQIYT